MQCCSVLLFIALSLFGNQQKHFVDFNDSQIIIKEEKNVLNVTLPFTIESGFHIQAESDVLNNLIATEISFEESEFYEITSHNFSLTNYESIELNEFSHQVLSDRVEVTVTLRLNDIASKKENNLKGALYYQACDDKRCFFPRSLEFQVDF